MCTKAGSGVVLVVCERCAWVDCLWLLEMGTVCLCECVQACKSLLSDEQFLYEQVSLLIF